MNDKYDNYSRDDFKYALDNYDYAIAEMQKKLLDKDQRIAELEEELKTKEQEHNLLINDFNAEIERLKKQIHFVNKARKRFVDKINELQEENAKLKEQLKNAIVPKYHIGQNVHVPFED